MIGMIRICYDMPVAIGTVTIKLQGDETNQSLEAALEVKWILENLYAVQLLLLGNVLTFPFQ